MNIASAIATLKDPKEFVAWLSGDEIDPGVIAKTFDNIEKARRADPEAARLIIEAWAGEFDRLVARLTALWPEEGDSSDGPLPVRFSE